MNLVVERDPPNIDREGVVGLNDLLEAGMRQLSVANQDAEPAGVEKDLMAGRDVVDDPANAPDVIWPCPLLAGEHGTGRNRPIDIGECIGLDVGARQPGAQENAPIGRDLLLEVHAAIPLRLVYWRTAVMSAGPPVSCAS